MTIITPDFIQRVLSSGGFADAQVRARDGTAHPISNRYLSECSPWKLVCDEVLDTQHDNNWYDGLLAELVRRGFTYEQLDRMRSFAWETAGWLNYDRVLWEWVSLDDTDIQTALDMQLKEGILTPAQHAERSAFIEHPFLIPASS